MSKKDFFRIIIKLFGLYTAIGVFFVLIPQNIVSIIYGFDELMSVLPLVLLIVSSLILYILLMKPDALINLFRLEKGFDDDRIELGSINGSGMLKLGLTIIAGFLIIDNFPELITNIIYSFKSSMPSNSLDTLTETFNTHHVDYFAMITSAIRLILGILILTNLKGLSKRLNKISDQNNEFQ